MSAIRFIIELFRRYRRFLLWNILLLLFVNLIGVASFFSLAPIIDMMIQPDMAGSSEITQKITGWMSRLGLPVTLWCVVLVFLLFHTFKNGFNILAQYSIYQTKYAVLRDLMIGTHRDFYAARWAFFSAHKQGTLVNTFNRELTTTGDAFGAVALMGAGLIQVCIYMLVPLYISWPVTLISVIFAVGLALPFLLLGKVSYRLGQANTETSNRTTVVLLESLSSAKLILGFGNQETHTRNLEHAFDAHRNVTVKSQTLGMAMPQAYEPLGLMVVVVALFAARRFSVPIAETLVMMWALKNCVPAIGFLVSRRNELHNFFPSYEQIMRLRQQATNLRYPTGGIPFSHFNSAITVEHVTFEYSHNDPVLTNVSIAIPKGSMVALVGKSGAGKSTLIDLVMGFHECTEGRIAIDGVSLSDIDIDSFRRRVGYVPQDNILFNMTIRDNLVWAKADASEEAVRSACRLANADEFIDGFRDGLDTVVGDRGVRLSGGQAQRISLARAILRKPELLILDEATSSLDSHSEQLIQKSINAIAEESTVIAIAHRLSTIARADRIYVIADGRVIEQGSYNDLVEHGGTFSRMIEAQALDDKTATVENREVVS